MQDRYFAFAFVFVCFVSICLFVFVFADTVVLVSEFECLYFCVSMEKVLDSASCDQEALIGLARQTPHGILASWISGIFAPIMDFSHICPKTLTIGTKN